MGYDVLIGTHCHGVDHSVLELQPLYRDLHWGFLGAHHRR
jgi:hypothetical protein